MKRNVSTEQLARILAYEYACGWKAHQEDMNLPAGMSASQWANANWSDFLEKAEVVLSRKKCKVVWWHESERRIYETPPSKRI